MKPYDKSKIGKFIGYGGEHIVYEYGTDKVIKFSLHVYMSGASAVAKKVADYEVGRRYFNEYVIPTEVIEWRNGKRAVELQNRVACRFLQKEDLKNADIKRQFDDIMARYRRLEAETGTVFDLFGREGLLSLRRPTYMSNIMVGEDGRLLLNDFTLLSLAPRWWEWPLWLVIRWARGRQEQLLRRFLSDNQD